MTQEGQGPQPACDLCGRKSPQSQMVISVQSISLCTECMKKLETLPEKLKETVEKFLIGNVI